MLARLPTMNIMPVHIVARVGKVYKLRTSTIPA